MVANMPTSPKNNGVANGHNGSEDMSPVIPNAPAKMEALPGQVEEPSEPPPHLYLNPKASSENGDEVDLQDRPADSEGPFQNKNSNRSSGGVKGLAKGLFGDTENMKDSLYDDIDKKAYDVTDFYHESPHVFADIAKNEVFITLTLFIISLNAIWIGVETDHNTEASLADADIGFQFGEHFFCVFFTSELMIRFLAFKKKQHSMKDLWFKFDSVLVSLMVLETWILPMIFSSSETGMGDLSLLRLLRLLRLSRLTRLMRAFPELVTIFKGMAAAARSVSTMLVLLVLCMYIFAIIFKVQVGDDPVLEEHFGSIPLGMWTLFLQGALLDGITEVLGPIRDTSLAMTFIFLIFVVIASFMTLNMLIGILCEVISAVSETENEAMVVNYVKQQLIDILDRIDADGTKTISKAEFKNLLRQQDFKEALETLGVDVKHLSSLSDTLFEVENTEILNTLGGGSGMASPQGKRASTVVAKSLEYSEFLEMLLGLRASKQVNITHIFDLRKFIRFQNKVTLGHITENADVLGQIVERQDRLEEKVEDLQRQLSQDMQEIKHLLQSRR